MDQILPSMTPDSDRGHLSCEPPPRPEGGSNSFAGGVKDILTNLETWGGMVACLTELHHSEVSGQLADLQAENDSLRLEVLELRGRLAGSTLTVVDGLSPAVAPVSEILSPAAHSVPGEPHNPKANYSNKAFCESGETSRHVSTVGAASRLSGDDSMSFELRNEWCDVEDSRVRDYARRHCINTSGSMRWCHSSDSLGEVNRHTNLPIMPVNICSHLRVKAKSTLRAGTTVMHPSGRPRVVWHAFCLGFISYDVVMMPLMAFQIEETDILSAVEWTCVMFWTWDVIMTFRTGFYVGSSVEMRPLKICRQYARTWLAVDSVIVLSEWVSRLSGSLVGTSVLRSSRAIRTLRLMRILRLAKLAVWCNSLEEQFSAVTIHLCLSLLKMTFGLLVLVHIVSCLWYAIGHGTDNGWTSYYVHSTEAPQGFVLWYFASVRWTLAQFKGRTDIDERRNHMELLYTCIVGVCLAILVSAVFVSQITTTMVRLSAAAAERNSMRRLVSAYLEYHDSVSTGLSTAIKRYLADVQSRRDEHEKELQLLALLPTQLANDLIYEVRMPLLVGNPFVQEIQEHCPRVMRRMCYEVAQVEVSVRWGVIFNKGDSCSRAIFIMEGTCKYDQHTESGEERFMFWASESKSTHGDLDTVLPRRTLSKGAWACEAALWIEWFNQGNLVADSYTFLLTFDVADLARLLRLFKDAYVRTVLYARNFAKDLAIQPKLSDIRLRVLSEQ